MKTYNDKLKSISITSTKDKSISDLKKIMSAINNYDFNVAYIDDLSTYKKAITKNKIIASALKSNDITSVKYYDTRILELN